MKILLFGASDHSAKLLQHLQSQPDYDVAGVVTQPSDNPVTKLSHKFRLPVWTPVKLDAEATGQIQSQLGQPDLILVLDYGLLIPPALFNWPKLGSLNIHYSLLPAYRGASPVAWAISDGVKKTGVSFTFLTEKFDQGDILAQKEIKIATDETAASLREKCLQATLETFDAVIKAWINRGAFARSARGALAESYQLFLPPKKQPLHSPAPLARRLSREDGQIDWSRPANYLERQIRAFYSWPGSFTTLGELARRFQLNLTNPNLHGKQVKILKAHLNNKSQLHIDQLQIEGKKPISWNEFLAGYQFRSTKAKS